MVELTPAALGRTHRHPAAGRAVLLVATIGMHAWAGLLVGQLNTTLATSSPAAGAAGKRPERRRTTGRLNLPDYAWDGTERINFLLLGHRRRWPAHRSQLTDTILAVSVDPVSKTAVMISVPRDTGFMPLPDRSVYPDGVYPKKINALSTEARETRSCWCPDLPAERRGVWPAHPAAQRGPLPGHPASTTTPPSTSRVSPR